MNDPEIKLEIKRLLPASVERVYAAWIDPAQLIQWHAPEGVEVKSASVDLKIGGLYKIEMGAEENCPVVSGKYIEIIKHKRLVYTWLWHGENQKETLVTVDFAAKNSVTEITLTHQRILSDASRNEHRSGWNGCLDNLSIHIQLITKPIMRQKK